MMDLVFDCLIRLGAEDIRQTNEGYECCCPVHKGRHRNFRVAYRSSKSTGVNAGRPGAFKCHNPNCDLNKGGYLEALVQLAWGCDYRAAQEIIKENGAMEWTPQEPVDAEEVTPEMFYPYVGIPCPYLLNRGFAQEDLDYFSIGFNPDTNMILFPTFDPEEGVVGLTRREARKGAIYIHTEFEKSHYLWGFDLAVTRTEYYSTILVTEGQLDPVGLRPVCNWPAVAQMGDNLSERQAELLVNHFDTIVLAYDNDPAGVMATAGGIDVLREAGADDIRILCYDAPDPADLCREGHIAGVKTTSRWIADHL